MRDRYGTGDSENSQTALKIVSAVKHKCGIESMAHISCLNLTRGDAPLILEQLKEHKIENILVLRGNRIPDREPAGDFRCTSDLMEFMKLHGDFNVIGACHPGDHQEPGGLVRDMKHLRDRVDVDVSQLITQLFSDNEYFYRFRERMDLVEIHVPVEARIMPVVSKKRIERMVSLCGVKLPRKFIPVIERCGDNPIVMRDAGVTYVVGQIVDLAAGSVDGIHLYTMNNPYIVSRIHEPASRLMAS